MPSSSACGSGGKISTPTESFDGLSGSSSGRTSYQAGSIEGGGSTQYISSVTNVKGTYSVISKKATRTAYGTRNSYWRNGGGAVVLIAKGNVTIGETGRILCSGTNYASSAKSGGNGSVTDYGETEPSGYRYSLTGGSGGGSPIYGSTGGGPITIICNSFFNQGRLLTLGQPYTKVSVAAGTGGTTARASSNSNVVAYGGNGSPAVSNFYVGACAGEIKIYQRGGDE